MAIADAELDYVERQLSRRAKPDMQRASSAAKLAREALALRAGSVLEPHGRKIGDGDSQPPSSATPALRRLAGERVADAPQRPLSTNDDTRINADGENNSDSAEENAERLARTQDRRDTQDTPHDDAELEHDTSAAQHDSGADAQHVSGSVAQHVSRAASGSDSGSAAEHGEHNERPRAGLAALDVSVVPAP